MNAEAQQEADHLGCPLSTTRAWSPELVEEDGVGERADGAAPPVVDDLDDPVEVGLCDATDVHGAARGESSPLSTRRATETLDAPSRGARSPRSHRGYQAPVSTPIVIAPSILSADFGRLADEVRAVEAAGADWIHVDVMDGRFVPNITIGPPVVKAMRAATTLPLDVHLMIVEPEKYLEDFAKAGADMHQRPRRGLARTCTARCSTSSSLGKRAGVVLNPATHERHARVRPRRRSIWCS